MSLISHTLEPLVAAVEANTSLDAPADRLQKLAAAIPAGPVRDALSRTAIGHPLHPLLVTLPIGAVVSAIAFDLTGSHRDASRRLIGYGILSAVPAAATGLSDWGDTEGAERRVDLVHSMSNTVGLALLTGSWLRRRGGGGVGCWRWPASA